MKMKSYRFLGERMEALGDRLDAARAAHKKAKSDWAKAYWQQVIDSLLFQWRNLLSLHEGEAVMSELPRWTVKYDFYERDDGMGLSFIDRVWNDKFKSPDLTASWERERARRLARAQ